MSHDDLVEAFHELDVDNNGAISHSEFVKMFSYLGDKTVLSITVVYVVSKVLIQAPCLSECFEFASQRGAPTKDAV